MNMSPRTCTSARARKCSRSVSTAPRIASNCRLSCAMGSPSQLGYSSTSGASVVRLGGTRTAVDCPTVVPFCCIFPSGSRLRPQLTMSSPPAHRRCAASNSPALPSRGLASSFRPYARRDRDIRRDPRSLGSCRRASIWTHPDQLRAAGNAISTRYATRPPEARPQGPAGATVRQLSIPKLPGADYGSLGTSHSHGATSTAERAYRLGNGGLPMVDPAPSSCPSKACLTARTAKSLVCPRNCEVGRFALSETRPSDG